MENVKARARSGSRFYVFQISSCVPTSRLLYVNDAQCVVVTAASFVAP